MTITSLLRANDTQFVDWNKSIEGENLSRLYTSQEQPERCVFSNSIEIRGFKRLSQEDLEKAIEDLKILKEFKPNVLVNFKKFLEERGFFYILENLDFNIIDLTTKIYDNGNGIGVTPYHATELLCNIDFSGITFKNCNFKYTNLLGSKFNNVKFSLSNFTYSVLKNCSFEKTKFIACTLKDAICNSSNFRDVDIIDSDLEYATFHNAKLSKTHFKNSSLNCVSFFKVQAKESNIENCQLRDTLFFQSYEAFGLKKEPKILKPIIGFVWNSETPGYTGTKQYLFLRNSGALILKLDACEKIDENKLSKEVEKKIKLAQIGSLSIPQMLFEKDTYEANDSEFNSTVSMVKEISNFLDAIVLPGGNDVHAEFFGGKKEENVHTEKSYYRDILEFSLIKESVNKGIPFQGICRGLQIANIYFGGNNFSKVYGQKKVVQTLTPRVSYGTIAGIVNNKIDSFSNHSQASNSIADELEVIIQKKADSPYGKVIIPKSMELKYSQAAMFILTQFHPELRVDNYSDEEKLRYPEFTSTSEENKKICSVIIDAAKQYKRKKELIT